ncbi:MAG: sugar phosphate isomerase/epimerase [Pseudomonadota bacterium]
MNNTASRRRLLQSLGALCVAGALPPSLQTAGAMARRAPTPRRTGIQLYTLREAMGQSVAQTLDAVAGMGFEEVEFAGYFNVPPARLHTMLNERGLSSPSSHVNARELRKNPEALVDAAAALGNRYVTIGWLDPSDRTSLADYRRWADVLNRAGELGAARGLKAAYHNHEFEFEALEGQRPHDVLRDNTDPALVDFELDFFWVAKVGLDVADVLAKDPARFTMAHIKDMDAAGNMADVGAGTIDFAQLLGDPAASGLRHFFVEHDNPAEPFRTAAIGRGSLGRILGPVR